MNESNPLVKCEDAAITYWKARALRLRTALERMDDRKHPMLPRSEMARIAKEALDNE